MRLRLQMAIRAEALGDADVQQFVNRDLRLLIMHGQQTAIGQAYRQTTPGSREYLEQALGEIDQRISNRSGRRRKSRKFNVGAIRKSQR